VINMYTDGSCQLQTRRGGWASILEHKGMRKIFADHAEDTTISRMELTAVIEGLAQIKTEKMPIRVYTDSQYVVNAYEYQDRWRQAFKRSDGQQLANIDLLKILYEQMDRFKDVKIIWIQGHNGHEWNEFADEIAKSAIDIRS